jgi:hypothetical protein
MEGQQKPMMLATPVILGAKSATTKPSLSLESQKGILFSPLSLRFLLPFFFLYSLFYSHLYISFLFIQTT